MTDDIWRRKVAALIHDPPEKALVLLRGKGHQAGTVAAMCRELFGSDALPGDLEAAVKTADRLASGADRAQWPREAAGRVVFASDPTIVHPMAGTRYDLRSLREIAAEDAERIGTEHMTQLICRAGGDIDWRRTALSLWRLAPEPPETGAHGLGQLWPLLPADTRVPDHSIFEHLRLVSALAGAGESPALLLVSLGPVQSFIAQGRRTSDLWAGSHLLSSLAWRALAIVADKLGPDAVLFPDLFGLPQCDRWLETQGVEVPGRSSLRRKLPTDSHPLFFASLPNRFVAIVPETAAPELAEAITGAVRRWVHEQAEAAWSELCAIAEMDRSDHARRQIAEQLEGFPEVSWSAAGLGDVESLARSLGAFYPESPPGFFGSRLWKLLSEEIEVDGATFFTPNAGVSYPAAHDLLERQGAAVKAARPFAQRPQRGYRCSLCGEREHLAPEADMLEQRSDRGSPWPRVAQKRSSLVKKGERLCAICALKRMWPYLVRNDAEDALGKQVRRYVVSTHAMALAPTLETLLESDAPLDELPKDGDWTALPRRLARAFSDSDKPDRAAVLRALPGAIDARREAEDTAGLEEVERAIENAAGARPEAYYALVLMDGDRMGRWLSGEARPACRKRLHAKLRAEIEGRYPEGPIAEYLDVPAASSPAYHGAVSRALSAFALEAAPFAVEELFLGKVIYAGGDDLLAMIGVRDLLGAMLVLRNVYSGTGVAGLEELLDGRSRESLQRAGFELDSGHLKLHRRLHRLLGVEATASMGVAVAHHMTPLGSVLRELRAAEGRAKEAGRDAFSIALMKRSGGTSHLTCGWHSKPEVAAGDTAPGVLWRLRNAFAGPVSRGAAYAAPAWVEPLLAGEPSDGELRERLAEPIAHVFGRQGARAGEARDLAGAIAGLAVRESKRQPGTDLAKLARGLLEVAEFLARETRAHDQGADR